MTGSTPYDRDPEALAWARGKVQEYLDQLDAFRRRAEEDREPVAALGCGIARQLTERHFFGDGGKVFGVFDERWAVPTDGEPE